MRSRFRPVWEESQLQRVDVARVLVVNPADRKVLMVKNLDRAPWSLPGGAVEPGERLAAAAVREAWEEAGVVVELGTLAGVLEREFPTLQEHTLFFTFHARILQGVPHVERPEEIEAVAWIDRGTADGYLIHDGGVEGLMGGACPYWSLES